MNWRTISVVAAAAGSAAILLGGGPLALAGLGRASSSVESDRAALGATLKSTAAAGYTVHALTLANQGVVKEFARSNGTVFAVTWRGAARPNLQQILGEHFDVVQADNASRSSARTRQPIAVTRSDLVVRTGGHSGAFWGVAILPQQAPAGLSAESLK